MATTQLFFRRALLLFAAFLQQILYLLRSDFTKRIYNIYHQYADILGMGDRLKISKLMGYLDDIEYRMKMVGFDLTRE